MLPDFPNAILDVLVPGSSASQIASTLARVRSQVAFMSQDVMAGKVGITRQTLSAIERQLSEHPTFNTLSKMADALNLCFAIDLSANTLRRRDGLVHNEDSPLAIYGDDENPVYRLSGLINDIRHQPKPKLTLKHLSSATDVGYSVIYRLSHSHDITMNHALDILAEFDFSLSIESKRYHQIWDQIGKKPHVVQNEHNQRDSNRPSPSVMGDKPHRLFSPAIKQEDGRHYYFEDLSKSSVIGKYGL